MDFITGNHIINNESEDKPIIERVNNYPPSGSQTKVRNQNEITKSPFTQNNQDSESKTNNNEKTALINAEGFPEFSPRYTYVDDGSGIIEHYVDQISNVDFSIDQGAHNIFSNLQSNDNIYDNMSFPFPNTTLIDGESFEGSWPPSGWMADGDWNSGVDQAFDRVRSADFQGDSSSGYLTTPTMDTSDADALYIEFYYRDESLDQNDFELELFNGFTWDFDYAGLDESEPENTWNFYSEKIIDSRYFIPNFRIRWYAESVSSGETAYVDFVTVKKEINVDLDLEVQFIDLAHFMGSETLAIKTGSFGSNDNLSLSYWTGSFWSSLNSNLLPNIWNNVSVSITESIYTIRLEGNKGITNWWQIDSILISIKGPGSNIYPVDLDTSDVDSSPDKGSIIDFNDAKMVDSIYSNFQEDASGTANTNSIDLTGGYLSSSTSDQRSVSGTISFWIKYDSVSGRQYGLHSDMEIRTSGGSLVLDWGSTGTLTSFTTFSTGIWYFNAIVWSENKNDLLFYSAPEGSEPTLDTNSLEGTWTSSISGLSFSSVYWGNGKGATFPLDGHLDEIRYYNKDRKTDEILSDFNRTLTGNEQDLVNYYKLNNDYNDIA
ncbi:MAG: hypothetical protein ACW99A_24065, partial [Candidatus Kariarchaeaceae archaeon]